MSKNIKRNYRVVPQIIEEEEHKKSLCSVPTYRCMHCSHAIRENTEVDAKDFGIVSYEISVVHVPLITCDNKIILQTQPYATDNVFCHKGDANMITNCSKCRYGRPIEVEIDDTNKFENATKMQKKYNNGCKHIRMIYGCTNKANKGNHYSISTYTCNHFKSKEETHEKN